MFKNIQDPSFKYINEKKIGKNYRLVKTSMIIDKSESVEINYLLKKQKINGEFLMFFLQAL